MFAPLQITADDRVWLAVAAIALKERLAIRHLLHQGFDVYWPHYLAAVRCGSHRGYALRSWFPPSWMFVAAPDDAISTIRRSMGILNVLHAGEYPLHITSNDLIALRAIADPSGLVPSYRPRILAPANMVEIKGENFLKILHSFVLASAA